MKSVFLTLPAAVLTGALAAAQTTHFVDNGPSFSFSPANISIDVGDTVTWVWKGGTHTVDSGSGGIPDGIFSSGTVSSTIGHTFSVVFDQAFLDANPVPGNVYPYMCIVHASFAQVGSVTVKQPPVVTGYGCLNPSGSLLDVSGEPSVGHVWTVGVHNPVGTQAVGSLAFLSASSLPAPGFPCGLPLPGFGMSGAGAIGELLIDLAVPNPILSLGPKPWSGSATPFNLPVPDFAAMAGVQLYFQGLILDTSPGAAVVFGATEGFAVTLGA